MGGLESCFTVAFRPSALVYKGHRSVPCSLPIPKFVHVQAIVMAPVAALAIRALSDVDSYIAIFIISVFAYTVDRFVRSTRTYRQRFKISEAHKCQPPPQYPHKEPLLGLDLCISAYIALRNNRYLEAEQSRFRETGNTYVSSFIGRASLNTCDPENIKTLLSTKFSDYVYGSPRSRRLRFRRLMGEGLMTSDGVAWKHSREMLQSIFGRGHERNLEVFDKYWGRLLERLPTNAASTVDLQPLFFGFTMETSLDLFVGSSRPPSFDDHVISNFTAAFDRGLKIVTVDFGLGPFTRFMSHSPLKLRKDRKLLESFIDHYVHDALAEKAASSSGGEILGGSSSLFLDELLQRTSDPIEIRAELMFTMVAARDTTACLLSNLWFILAQRPDIFAKLRQEITSTFPLGEKLDLARLERLPYLKCCINECAFFFPSVPGKPAVQIQHLADPEKPSASTLLFLPI